MTMTLTKEAAYLHASLGAALSSKCIGPVISMTEGYQTYYCLQIYQHSEFNPTVILAEDY